MNDTIRRLGRAVFPMLPDALRIQLLRFTRTRVANVGLSNELGKLYWNPDPENPFNAGLGSRPGSADSQAVDVVRLDGFLEEDPLPRVDFIKIDVEGMEPEVLQGAKKTLERFRPIVVFETLELFRQQRGVDIFAMSADLRGSLDYDLFEFTAEDRLIPVDRDRMPYNTLARPR
jgi:FkbM family methyltransferase